MQDEQIRFDDGAAYEEFMGKWSRLAGEIFLEWLAPAAGASWVDVGCGNGAFTELLVERCAPAMVQGIDPSQGQIDYALTRLESSTVQFQVGDSMALPYADASFDAAVMALVIFFVPEPAKGVAEMVRVVKPGGSVSAYAWDILGDGFPLAALQQEMAAFGMKPLWPPSVEASRIDAMKALWKNAGLVDVEARKITVRRTFVNFDAFWSSAMGGTHIASGIAKLPASDAVLLKDRLYDRLPKDPAGQIKVTARANAIKGRLPA
ncbi:MAG: Methyltransferase type 11 [Rhizobacter sp.]|nr:Methyltransferase type 11 [Rhizobacter sp.]